MQKLGWAAVGVVMLWAAFVLLATLGAAPLETYDEGTYAQVVSESLERGDFLTFTLGYTPWFEKPPLYFWLAGITTWLTGDAALGIRLPAALAAVAVVALVMLLVFSVSRSLFAAAFSGALLLLTQPFIDGAREARLDLLVSLFIVSASYFSILQKTRRWPWWFWVSVALAVLSKSVIAAFAFVPLVVLAAYRRDWSFLSDRQFWYGALLGAALVLPWHIHQLWLHGQAFWHNYVVVHLLERYETNLFIDPNLQTNYTAHLFWFAPLMTGLFLLSLVLAVYRWRSLERRDVLLALLLTAAAMLLVFYTAQTRAFSYLLPVYPFAAAFCALIIRSFTGTDRDRLLKRAVY